MNNVYIRSRFISSVAKLIRMGDITVKIKQIRDKCIQKIYTTKSKSETETAKRFKSDIWSIFHEIFNERNELVKDFVICSVCNEVMKYDPKGTGGCSFIMPQSIVQVDWILILSLI